MQNHKNEDLDALIEAAPLGIVVFDSNAVITRWNPAAEKIFGWKESEVLGRAYNPVLPEGDDEVYREMRKKLLGGGSLIGEEVLRKRKDGKYINVKAHSSLLKDKSGNVTGVIGMYDDITEQKREHEKLVWNELLMRQMTDSTRNGFYLVDNRSDKILYCNKRFAGLWGLEEIESINELSNDQLINLCSQKVKEKDKYSASLNALKDINNETVYTDEVKLTDGRTIKYYTTPIKDSKNNYLGRFFMFEDNTESKLYETLLRSENEYNISVESSGDVIIVVDSAGKILVFNKAAEKLFKADGKKLKNRKIHEILNTEDFLSAANLSYGRTETFIKDITCEGSIQLRLEFHVRLHTHNKIQITVYETDKQQSGSRQSRNNFAEMQSRFIFTSEIMKKINFELTRLANLDFDVLIEGETGVGKDLAAAQIHMRSKRNNKPFIPVSISTLNESLIESELFGHEKGAYSGADKQMVGKFEAADKGILYIPEISALPEKIQLKLLHFMQYKSITRVGQDARQGEINIDVRLIMATNENIEELVKTGRIRKDFYYRISGTTLTIPPLRERKDDIRSIAEYYVEKFSSNFPGKHYELSEDAIALLREYPWYGNVRELVSCIKNVISFNSEPVIELSHFKNLLRMNAGSSTEFNTATELTNYDSAETVFKKHYFKNLLEKSNHKITEASKLAGMTPQGLRKALNKLGL